jgi:hypothetical protein
MIDSMNTEKLEQFDDDNELLEHLQIRNYQNYLFVYGTKNSESTPTFERLNKDIYDSDYGALDGIPGLETVHICNIHKYFNSNGSNFRYVKKDDGKYYCDNNDSIDEQTYHKLLNAVFAKPQIHDAASANLQIYGPDVAHTRTPKWTDIVDEIIDTSEDIEKDSTNKNFKGTDVKEIFENYENLKTVVQYFEKDKTTEVKAFNEKYKSMVEPFYHCITLYSDDVDTILQKLKKHSIESIYDLCIKCNDQRDPKFWCNPYTFSDEDVQDVTQFFESNPDEVPLLLMGAFIKDNNNMSSIDLNNLSISMQRFKKLVDLNKDNKEKSNKQTTISSDGTVRTYKITMQNRFVVLSNYAFENAKKTNKFERLFEKTTSGGTGKKTHKLRIKLNNKTKSLRHKTWNAINRL